MLKLPLVTVAASSFPAQEQRWLEAAAAGRSLPREPEANCADCTMCKPHSEPLTSIDVLFDDRSTCCTIIPHIQNYRLGQMLAAKLPGDARLRERLASRRGLTPLGLGHTVEQAAADARMRKNHAFGTDVRNRCPYYDEVASGCTVWHLRPSLCSTWHCRYERGQRSQKVWLALRDLLNMAERALSRWCLQEVGLDETAFAYLFPAAIGSLPATAFPRTDFEDERSYQRGWANYFGREEEFFAACAEVSAGVDWDQLRQRMGSEGLLAEKLLQGALDALTEDQLPERLEPVAPKAAVRSGAGKVRVRSYSSYDIRDWPQDLLLALREMPASSPEAMRSELQTQHGLNIDNETLARLLDFGLLREAQ